MKQLKYLQLRNNRLDIWEGWVDLPKKRGTTTMWNEISEICLEEVKNPVQRHVKIIIKNDT
jgi:hypothetical protein